jgi:O-antigen/teichoic acid export membrane protein
MNPAGRKLARNTVFNLFGQVAPMLVAFVAMPLLITGLGTDRFGILLLAWTAIGYFSLFDLGLSRSLTQAVSAALGGGREDELPALTAAALRMMRWLGVIGGALFALLTPLLVTRALKVPDTLHGEATEALYLLAFSLPFVLTTAGLKGLLEAHQDFGLATALRIPYALFNFVAPLAVLPFSNSVVPVVGILVGGRVVTWAAHAIVCRRRYSFLGENTPVRRAIVLPMLRQGGWMAISNVISPLMVVGDRFLVGSLLSISAVAYYATPFDMLIKLLVIPGAILGVLFPAFAATFDTNRSATARLLERAIRLMIVVMFPMVIVLVTFARPGLVLWLGVDFARASTEVVQWLAAGVFINSIGQIPFAALQGIGRADLTAKLHAVELPLYAAAIIWLTRTFGLNGVAMAWTLRVAFDTTALFWLTAHRLPEARAYLRAPLLLGTALLALLWFAASLHTNTGRFIVAAIALVAFSAYSWFMLIAAEERTVIKRWLGIGYSSPATAA